MRSTSRLAILISLVVLLIGPFGLSPASGQQPFQYYPAYGAHRGRMVYRQGPFGGTRQKIHWGGGLTESGAAVLLGAIDAAGPILGSVLGARETEERGVSDAEHQRSISDDQRLLAEAEALRARTQQLLNSFLGGGPAPLPQPQPQPQPQPIPGGPITPGPGTGSPSIRDDFQDWRTPGPG